MEKNCEFRSILVLKPGCESDVCQKIGNRVYSGCRYCDEHVWVVRKAAAVREKYLHASKELLDIMDDVVLGVPFNRCDEYQIRMKRDLYYKYVRILRSFSTLNPVGRDMRFAGIPVNGDLPSYDSRRVVVEKAVV